MPCPGKATFPSCWLLGNKCLATPNTVRIVFIALFTAPEILIIFYKPSLFILTTHKPNEARLYLACLLSVLRGICGLVALIVEVIDKQMQREGFRIKSLRN